MGDESNSTVISTDAPEATKSSGGEQSKLEYYKSYDVMTGVRIAITLGGFFSLMVLLVVYKSKCKSRSISEENLEATVAAAVIEEEQLGLSVRQGYGFYSAQKPFSTAPTTRFSSVDGGYGIYAAPMKYPYSSRGRVSLPTSSPYIYPSPLLARDCSDSPPPHPFKEICEDYEIDFTRGPQLLRVPSSRRGSRRLSSVTCSSCDTSYLERRGSSMEVGRPIAPPYVNNGSDRLEEEPWDFYYPIDIQVIQPTPEVSPAESQISIHKCKEGKHQLSLCVPKVAPLASISSCKLATFDQQSHSIGSDSVFLDDELIDTEDEVEEFSTDSDAENLECIIPSKLQFVEPRLKVLCSKLPTEQSRINRVPSRRNSSPMPPKLHGSDTIHLLPPSKEEKPSTSTNSSFVSTIKSTIKSSSDSDTIHITKGIEKLSSSLSSIPRTCMSASCDHLVKALQEHSAQSDDAKKLVEHCSWSQETLF